MAVKNNKIRVFKVAKPIYYISNRIKTIILIIIIMLFKIKNKIRLNKLVKVEEAQAINIRDLEI